MCRLCDDDDGYCIYCECMVCLDLDETDHMFKPGVLTEDGDPICADCLEERELRPPKTDEDLDDDEWADDDVDTIEEDADEDIDEVYE